jgi:glycosyltransferase involved in cell wall biosynthesis
MKISIVVPTFRRPLLLRKCIDAVALQDFPGSEYELIIVTDGPDAASEKLVGSYKGIPGFNIRFFSLSVKKGPAAARNLGWRKSRGELMVFTDDDCLPSPGWLDAYWQSYGQIKNKSIAFTGRIIVPVPPCPTDYERNVSRLETADFVTANCACPVTVLEETGGFDESFTMAWREDSDFEFRLLEKNIPIQYVLEAVVVHPVRKAPWGVSIWEQKKSMFNPLLYKKHPELYREKINGTPAKYYAILLSALAAIIALLGGSIYAAILFFSIGCGLVIMFTIKRLSGNSRSLPHVMEMITTSFLIPFLSVYWTLYGALKYKVFYL